MKIEVIAEIGCNHNGNFERAKNMIGFAKRYGADAVKFQYYSTEEIIELERSSERSLYTEDMFKWIKKTEFTIEQFDKLKEHCREVNIEFLCTPFINPKFVEELDLIVDRWKIRERDARTLEDNPLLEAALKTRKEILISRTSLPTNDRLRMHPKIKYLHCIPKYPAWLEDLDLGRVHLFDGYSNHIPNELAPLSTAISALSHGKDRWIVEVHVRPLLFRPEEVIDKAVSFNYQELGSLINKLREINKCKVTKRF